MVAGEFGELLLRQAEVFPPLADDPAEVQSDLPGLLGGLFQS